MDALKRHVAQLLHRAHTDQQVIGHLGAIEFGRHAGQLQLAVQRLVRNAQKRAVGHAEAEAVRRDRCRFHVEPDGARLAQPVHRAGLVAQLPVAVGDGGDGAGAHDPLQLVALEFGDLGHRLLQRHLHLGERRDRHPDRQVVIKHAILAQVGMRQHEIAQRLRVAQPGAMADHHPDMRAQHRDMVGRGLGIRGADADVHQRDAVPVGALEVIGRHLRQLGKRRDHPVGGGDLGIARGDEARVTLGRIGEFRPRHLLELLDVELVVGEQHVVLEMLGRGRGVMAEPRERIVDALRGEGRKMARAVRVRPGGAVHDVVVHRGEVGHVEDVAQREGEHAFLRHGHAGLRGDGEMHRDRRRRGTNLHRHAMVADQKPDLLRQIVAEQVGPGDRRHIGARQRHMAEAEPAVGLEMRGDGQPHLGVEGAEPRHRAAALQHLVEFRQQEIRRLGVELFQPGHRGLRIGEQLGRGGMRRQDGQRFVHSKRSVSSKRVTSTRPRSEIRISGMTTSASSECCM
ncbi:hypothetical protein SDC9_06364 [bioreactor metagenome]|uniref:Uncharacterized protein n=1 Tax=bioreactor metagenome TaxID=1076179 RepID=A0A644T3T8_9ZZZZ